MQLLRQGYVSHILLPPLLSKVQNLLLSMHHRFFSSFPLLSQQKDEKNRQDFLVSNKLHTKDAKSNKNQRKSPSSNFFSEISRTHRIWHPCCKGRWDPNKCRNFINFSYPLWPKNLRKSWIPSLPDLQAQKLVSSWVFWGVSLSKSDLKFRKLFLFADRKSCEKS